MENHLTNYFSSSNTSATHNLLQFITRKQHPNERIAQYYEVIQELALKAYATTPREIVDSYINEYFIKGLYSTPLKQQLLLTKASDKTDVLANALELQTKFAVLNESNDTFESFVQHLEEQKQTNQQQNHNNNNNCVSNNANRHTTHNEQSNGCMNNNDNTLNNNFQQQNQTFKRNRVRYEDIRQRNFNHSHGNTNVNHNTQSNAQTFVNRDPNQSNNQGNTMRQQRNPFSNDSNNYKCYNCNQQGHLSRNCLNRNDSSNVNDFNNTSTNSTTTNTNIT